jgi:23S rRNA (guanosine2251-2'-O)-methyltransferase
MSEKLILNRWINHLMLNNLIHGIHAVQAALNNPTRVILQLTINQERTDKRLNDLLHQATERNVPIVLLSASQMKQQFPDMLHQGVIAELAPLPPYTERDLPDLLNKMASGLILILDGVTDPHNLGACLRSADATGVSFVVIPKDKSAGVTAVVSKVACGAAESVPIVTVTNLARAMKTIQQQGVWIYGAAGDATSSLYALDCTSSIAIVLGAEGQGLRRLTREQCDGLFAIPMQGQVSSLNVSVAAGVCLYEVVRQRLS